MDMLKTIGKRMKPIFVFVLLEALLAGILIGCQTQGLDLDGDLRLILSYCFILFVALFPMPGSFRYGNGSEEIGDVAFWLLSPCWSSGCCMTCAG